MSALRIRVPENTWRILSRELQGGWRDARRRWRDCTPDTVNSLRIPSWDSFLFGINQGGTFEDIRIAHADTISKMNCDGYAVGGLAVGESHEEMYRILDAVVPHLPEEKPTYLMGVGTPTNILEAVDRGVDFFDCVYPTRNGRHGHVYTNHGKINLFNE